MFEGVRGFLNRVVLRINPALLDIKNLLPDADEGVAEPVQLLLVLRLRGFNHQGPGDGPAHGRGVEAKVHETLGNVDRLHAASLLEVPHVDDELVSHLEEGGEGEEKEEEEEVEG